VRIFATKLIENQAGLGIAESSWMIAKRWNSILILLVQQLFSLHHSLIHLIF
jgi:hypothetical protein